jgi:ribose-phosphate pyrophosphokinase
LARRRGRPDDEDPLVFAGTASPKLTDAICRELGVPRGNGEVIGFSEGTLFVRVLENVRGRSVYLVQSTVFPTNDNFVELLFWIDAFSRASADSVTVVIPYFSYHKGDKKDEHGCRSARASAPTRSRPPAPTASWHFDLHAPQIQGFFRIPVDDLYALPYLCAAIQRMELRDPVVVAPDAGFAKRARRFARRLDAPLAIADKVRKGHDETAELVEIIGDVGGCDANIVDDFTISAGTLVGLASRRSIDPSANTPCVTTAVAERAPRATSCSAASTIRRLVVTDSIETQPAALCARR